MNILFVVRVLTCFVFLCTSSSFAKRTKLVQQEPALRELPSPLTIIKKQTKKTQNVHKKGLTRAQAQPERKKAVTTLPQSCPNIRVLIEEHDAQTKNIFSITSKHGLHVQHEDEHQESPIKKIVLSVEKNKLYRLGNKKYTPVKDNTITVYSVQERLSFNNTSYEGAITLHLDTQNAKLLIINKLSIDDYIYAVLGCESLPYWPLEMQKIQAIISRTYAVYQMQQTRNQNKKTLPYDIKKSNIHQVYNGSHQLIHLREAVSDTHNLILTHHNTVALAMFDVCCGGIATYNMRTKDSDNPYLYRKNRCLYCSEKKEAHWQRVFPAKILFKKLESNHALKKKLKDIGTIRDIEIKNKDKAGVVHTLKLIGSRSNTTITINQFNASLSKKLRSKAFTLKRKKHDIILTGTGYGHLLGLCQLGAREMVQQGYDFKEILAFYYPGTKFARLTPKKAHT